MALLAKTNNTIEITGRNNPIPFSAFSNAPGKLSSRYTNNPSKIKFNMILRRPKTNWFCLDLNEKTAIIDNKAEAKNRHK
jgi:hypothetical protein